MLNSKGLIVVVLIMIKPQVKGKTLRFGSQLSKGNVLGTPHFYCIQWDPHIILGLVCVSKGMFAHIICLR